MLKFPFQTPLDPKEAAIIDRRRKNEAERRNRIFNARERLFGVDKKSLEEQISERRTRQDAEHMQELAYQQTMLQNSQLALLSERDLEKEKRRLRQEINTFRELCQRPQDRASYVLNGPDGLKKSFDSASHDDNVTSGISSVFQGEDVMDEKRRELQRKQQKAWLDQQIKEKAIAESVRRNEEMSQEGTALLLDRKAVELDIAEQEARRLQKEALAEFNKALMAEKDACHRERERLELLDKQAEMTNCITGDFLTENPDVAASAFGPHRLIPDRWKGMSLEKRQQIRKEQLQQALEEKKRREDEKQRNADWQCRINELDRCAILFERELMKKRREQNKALLNQNQMLSQEQRARNEHLNKFVYSNTPTEEYFKQFNTSTR